MISPALFYCTRTLSLAWTRRTTDSGILIVMYPRRNRLSPLPMWMTPVSSGEYLASLVHAEVPHFRDLVNTEMPLQFNTALCCFHCLNSPGAHCPPSFTAACLLFLV